VSGRFAAVETARSATCCEKVQFDPHAKRDVDVFNIWGNLLLGNRVLEKLLIFASSDSVKHKNSDEGSMESSISSIDPAGHLKHESRNTTK